MATELGVGYISIVPETSKIAPSVNKALTGAGKDAQQQGSTMGSKLATGMTKTLKYGAVAAGAGVATVLGTALTKGFQRLTAIEDAKAKLEGLGNSAGDTAKIMDNAMAAVKGTAFSMDEAATAAASAVAAGVKPGQDLQHYLGLVGDAATIAGVSMQDMGSVFGKVMTSGKVQGDVFAQMSDMGIPVVQQLADSMGKSAEEIYKMGSAGEISSEQFLKAMGSMEGAALKSGDTTTGALKNMNAAIARTGASLLEGLMPSFRGVFSAITEALDNMAPKFKDMGLKIGAALGPLFDQFARWATTTDFSAMIDPLIDMAPAMANLAGAMARIAGTITIEVWIAFANVLQALVPVINNVLVPALNLLSSIAASQPGLIQGLVYAWAGMKVVGLIAGPIGTVVTAMRAFAGAMAVQTALAAASGVTLSSMGAAWAVLQVKMSGVVMKLRASNIALAAQKVGMVASTVATWAATAATTAWGVALAVATSPITWIVAAIAAVVAGLVLFFTKTELGRSIWSGFVNVLKASWSWISGVFAAVWDYVSEKFISAWDTIKSAFSTAIGFISEHWKTLLTIFGGPLGAAIAGIATHWDTIKNAAGVAIDWISGKWSEFTTGLGQFVDTWVQPIITAFNAIKSIVSGLFTGIGQMFSGDSTDNAMGGMLIKNILGEDMGQAVIDAIEWIKNAFTSAQEGISIAIDWISAKWSEFTTGFGMFYATWIQPVLDGFGLAWSTISAAVGIAIDWISVKWSEFATAFGMFWSTWIQPILTTMMAVWSAVASAIGTVITAVIIPAWSALGTAISAVWTGVISVVWNAIKTGAQVLGTVLAGAWEVVKAGFSAMGQVFMSIWNNLVRPVFDLLRNIAGVVADVLTGNFSNIGNRFRAMGTSIHAVVTGVIRVALDTMKAAVGFVGQAWQAFATTVGNVVGIVRGKVEEMVGVVKSIPDRIRSFFADAGSWLVNAGKNLINGFIEGINSMFDSVSNAIGSITSILPGFGDGGIVMAHGGIVTVQHMHGGIQQLEKYANGGGSLNSLRPRSKPRGFLPTQATIARPRGARGMVQWAERETGGEAFIPLAQNKRERSTAILGKVADMFGYGLINKDSGQPVNNTYNKNLGPVQMGTFAEGGITGQRLLDFVWGRAGGMTRPLEGTPYVWGGGRGPNDWGDCSGAQSIIAGFLAGRWNGRNPTRLFATMNEAQVLRQLGYTIGRPPASFVGHAVGWKNGGPAGGHTAGTIFAPGKKVNVEMGGGRGNGQIGGRAAGWNDGYFNQFAYRKALGQSPTTGPMLDATGAIKGGEDAGAGTGSSSTSTSTKPSTPSFGKADELYKQAAAYLGVMEDLSVSVTQKQVQAAGDQKGSNWNAIPLDQANVAAAPTAKWGPSFFNYEIARQAKAKGLPIRGAMIGIGTTLVESGDPQKMYANRGVPASLSLRHDAVGSDHDSVGLFQQRQAGWGTLAQRMSPFESAGLFFNAMLRKFGSTWQTMDPGAVAQGVQVSAFPGRYAGKMPKALQLAKGTRLYDQGGVLQNGGMSLNLSGKPEAILTNSQWNDFTRATVATAAMLDPMRVMAKDTRDTAIYTQQMAKLLGEQTAQNAANTAAAIGQAAHDAVPRPVWDTIDRVNLQARQAAEHWNNVSNALRTKAIAWAHGEWPIGSGRTWKSTAPNPEWQSYSLDKSLQSVTAANMEIVRRIARGEQKAGNDPVARAVYDVFGRTPITHSLGKIIAAGPDGWRDATGAMVKAFETGDRRDLYKWADEYSQLTHAILTVREQVMASGKWVAEHITIPLEKFAAQVEATRKYIERAASDVAYIASKGIPAIGNSLNLLSDIAVTGQYADNPYYKEDSPLVDAAMAMHEASLTIKKAFDDTSTNVYKSGMNFGGEWLAQAQIVKDAQKGLDEMRKQQVDTVYDYRELDKARKQGFADLTAAGGIENATVKTRLNRLDDEVTKAWAGNDPEVLQEAQERQVRTANEIIRLYKAMDTDEGRKKAAAMEALRDANQNITNQRLNQLNATNKLEAAERTLAAARYTAMGDLIKQVGDAIKTPLDSAVKFAEQMGKAAGVVEKLRQQVAQLRIESVNLRIKSASAAFDLREAEQSVAKTRAENLISIAKAEADLAEAQRGHLTMGASSVDALAMAIDRFRVSGVATIDEIALTYIANTAEVKAAEWALKQVRAESNLQEKQAVFDQLKATMALQQATALQVYTTQMQSIVSQQLAAQTQAVMGMSQQAANGFGRFASGASQGATGLFGLLGNVAGGLASFATGNIAGVVANVVGGIGNLGGLILGGNKMAQNKDEAAEAFDKMDLVTKLGLGLSLLGGGAAVGIGAAASYTMGPEMLGYGAQVGGQLVGTAFDTVAGMLADNMEAVNGRYEDILAKMKLDFDMNKALEDASLAAAQAKWDMEKAALQAQIDEAKLGVEQAKYEQGKQVDEKVVAAYESAMGVFRDRAEALSAAVTANTVAIEAAAGTLGGSPQPINVTIQSGTYNDRDVKQIIDDLFARMDSVEANVTVEQRTPASQYLASKIG